jgi:hypothetical protein
VWRKIPGLKQAVMYRIHRDLAGEDLSRWLAHKTGTGGGALRAAA